MSASTASRAAREPIPPTARRAALAGAVGSFIEYFDYLLFSVFTVYLAPAFFPADQASASVLIALAVYGVGYVAKPVGGIVFGRLGDRRGRRTALLTTILLMGACTSLIAVLPTYAQVGVLAPVLLVVLRLGQGASSGAELQGALTYVLESAPPSRRTHLASAVYVGSFSGGASGALLAAVLGMTASRAWMLEWGWRIPFLVALPLTVIGFVVRRRLEDSREFRVLVERNEVTRSPLREALVTHRRPMVLACVMALGFNIPGGLIAWIVPYLSGIRGLSPGGIALTYGICSFLALPALPATGRLVDRHGHRAVLASIMVAYAVLSTPLMWLFGTAQSPLLLGVGILVLLVLICASGTVFYTYLSELFPTDVRFTGATFANNVGATAFGGTSALIATALVLGTGSIFAPVGWVVLGAVLILVPLALAPRVLRDRLPSTPAEGRMEAPVTPSTHDAPRPVAVAGE